MVALVLVLLHNEHLQASLNRLRKFVISFVHWLLLLFAHVWNVTERNKYEGIHHSFTYNEALLRQKVLFKSIDVLT